MSGVRGRVTGEMLHALLGGPIGPYPGTPVEDLEHAVRRVTADGTVVHLRCADEDDVRRQLDTCRTWWPDLVAEHVVREVRRGPWMSA